MSRSQYEIKKENLIQEYREGLERWNGEDEGPERKLQDIAAELEEMGVNVEDLEDS